MKNILYILIFLTFLPLTAQEIISEKPSSLIFNFGRNKHGTGDIPGYQYGIIFNRYFSKKLFYSIGFEGTLQDEKQIPFIYEVPGGNIINGTLNDVTGGFQIVTGLGFTPLRIKNHDFGLSINALGRYQATSINDVTTQLFPALTGLDFPILIIENYEDQRTLALGAALKVFYNYKFNSGWLINLAGAFQTDTNEDTISSVMLGFGKSF